MWEIAVSNAVLVGRAIAPKSVASSSAAVVEVASSLC